MLVISLVGASVGRGRADSECLVPAFKGWQCALVWWAKPRVGFQSHTTLCKDLCACKVRLIAWG
jgi:hypothetical protein